MVAHIFKDKNLRLIFSAATIVLIITAVVGYFKFGAETEKIIIHFDIFRGVDILGNKIDVLAIIIYGFIVSAINFFLADFLYERERFLSYVFSFTTLFLSFLILVVISIIISKN